MIDEKEKIVLRKLKEKDAVGMLEWMHDADIQRNFRFLGEEMNYISVLEFIHNSEKSAIDGSNYHYAITNNNDEYLGTISLKNVNTVSKNAEYAICLRKMAQGRGIGVEATKAILKIAFYDLKLQRVYLNVLSENERAIRLYTKCGFMYEGEFRDHLFLRGEYKSLKWYGLLRDEYECMWREHNMPNNP